MADVTHTEAIASAIAHENAGTTPVGVNTESVGHRLREGYEEQGWKDSLIVAREPAVEPRIIGEKIEQIGFTRNAKTGAKERGAPGSDERDRYDRAVAAKDRILKYLKSGFDDAPGSALTNTDRDRIVDATRMAVLKVPALAAQYNLLGGPEKTAMLQRIIRDPRYNAQIKEVVKRIVNSETNNLGDVVADKDEKVKEKEADLRIKKQEIQDADRIIKALDNRLGDYRGPAVGAPGVGTKAYDIGQRGAVYGDLSVKETELSTTTAKRDSLKEKLSTALRLAKAAGGGYVGPDPAAIADEINTANDRIATLQGEITPLKSKLSVIDTFIREQQELENQHKTALKEKRERQVERTKLEGDIRTLRREYEDAKNLRASMEMNIVEGLEGAFTEAANEAINAQVDALGAKYDEKLGEAKKETADHAAQVFYDRLMSQIQTTETRRRWAGLVHEERHSINRENVNMLYGDLISRGPEGAMIGVITGMRNPSTGATYTQEEARDLMKTEQFAGKSKNEFIKQVLARRLLTGGIGQEDLYVITNSEWGQGILEEAYNSNQSFRENVKKMIGTGDFREKSFRMRFLQEAGTAGRLFWLLFFGIGIPYVAIQARRAGRIDDTVV